MSMSEVLGDVDLVGVFAGNNTLNILIFIQTSFIFKLKCSK